MSFDPEWLSALREFKDATKFIEGYAAENVADALADLVASQIPDSDEHRLLSAILDAVEIRLELRGDLPPRKVAPL